MGKIIIDGETHADEFRYIQWLREKYESEKIERELTEIFNDPIFEDIK